MNFFRKRFGLKNQKGYTLVELLVVVAIIGIISLIAFSTYTGLAKKSARARAQADVAAIARAVGVIAAHCNATPGALVAGAWSCTETTDSFPEALTVKLTSALVDGSQVIGPLFNTMPSPPAGWGAYTLVPIGTASPGAFRITSIPTGGGAAVNAP